jgi:hypothetical protein
LVKSVNRRSVKSVTSVNSRSVKSIKSVNKRSVKSVKSVNIRLTWVMKRLRFDFFKGKKKRIKHFVLTKMMSFRFMSVQLIGRLKGGSVQFGSIIV